MSGITTLFKVISYIAKNKTARDMVIKTAKNPMARNIVIKTAKHMMKICRPSIYYWRSIFLLLKYIYKFI